MSPLAHLRKKICLQSSFDDLEKKKMAGRYLCRACGNPVSLKDEVCPTCGARYPVREEDLARQRKIIIFGMIFCGAIFLFMFARWLFGIG